MLADVKKFMNHELDHVNWDAIQLGWGNPTQTKDDELLHELCDYFNHRLENEPLEFHARVRQEFLNLANVDPERYAVIDATGSVEEISAAIRHRVNALPGLKMNVAKKK